MEFRVDSLDDNCFQAILDSGAAAFAELRRCVEMSQEPCEGNVMFLWNSWQLEPGMIGKQKNLYALTRALAGENDPGDDPPRVLEVGFNAGHSVCLMLLANPRARVVSFDLCEHTYTLPCAEALRRIFGAERLELHPGPSTETLPAYRAANPGLCFDLFHVDGGHQYQVGLSDVNHCWHMARKPPSRRSLLVLDDTDLTGVRAVWEDSIAAGRILELPSPHALGEFRHGVGELICDDIAQGEGTCAACGRRSAPRTCGGCHGVRYCSEACARAHWKLHRSVCESRRPAPLIFPALDQVTPSKLLRTGYGGGLFAVRNLNAGEVLFSAPPLAWQPLQAARARMCARCGQGNAQRLSPCPVCCQAAFCEACKGSPCGMCPELKITKGHVGPRTLLALDIVRRREARSLPGDALPLPCNVSDEHKRLAASVQRVGHFCSAVRWSDKAAAEVVAAIEPGGVNLPLGGDSVAIGYYPTFARLRAAGYGQKPSMGNVRMSTEATEVHRFILCARLCQDVVEGGLVYLRS